MKKHLGLVALWIGVISGFAVLSHAANTCTSTDMYCYQSGPSQSLNTLGRMDSSGNVTVGGNQSVTGNVAVTGNQTTAAKTIFTKTTSVAITSITTISPTATYMTVASTAPSGATVTCGANTTPVFPCISTATATDGQYLVIGSTTNTGTVTFSSGTAAGMDLGAATRLVQYGKVLTLLYDAVNSIWREVSYGNN